MHRTSSCFCEYLASELPDYSINSVVVNCLDEAAAVMLYCVDSCCDSRVRKQMTIFMYSQL